ncbi:MAG: homocysteine S-methyltransferase family protein [Rhodocyclaceae bacterium]|nr:homocysteine S-methyltransferase family protein [Rhodocyclaceae bacterium]
MEDPSFRNVTFPELVTAYTEQVSGLMDGGSDILMVETIFDTLNAKAALFAIDSYFEAKEAEHVAAGKTPEEAKALVVRPPLFISGTIVDLSGRTLSGQTVEGFYTSVMHSKPFAIGLNCALGATQMKPFVQRLAKVADCYVFTYPNAGLPNAMGGYDDTPEQMGEYLRDFALSNLINLAGGCCGSSPAHIKAIGEAVNKEKPRVWEPSPKIMRLSGLEALAVDKSLVTFANVGERCNIAGSIQFKRLILAGKFQDAMAVARKQASISVGMILSYRTVADLVEWWWWFNIPDNSMLCVAGLNIRAVVHSPFRLRSVTALVLRVYSCTCVVCLHLSPPCARSSYPFLCLCPVSAV